METVEPNTPLPEGVPANTPGFLVTGYCDRQWFVPMTAVEADYAFFLKDTDGISEEAARAKVLDNKEFMPTWFYEQCIYWGFMETQGLLVTKSTRFKTKPALDRLRGRAPRSIQEVLLD